MPRVTRAPPGVGITVGQALPKAVPLHTSPLGKVDPPEVMLTDWLGMVPVEPEVNVNVAVVIMC